MSTVTPDLAWFPPQFPEKGRLPSQSVLIGQNCYQQESLERAHHDALCAAAGRRVSRPCCKTLHISLFFDGTGNNLNHDLYTADPKHPTNIARLFRASIGQGYAAGTGDNNQWLVDVEGSAGNQYYKYYIPGVGTPFPEIMDLDFSADGLAFATYGEDRINWGLLRLIDALRRTLGKGKLSDVENWQSIKAMATTVADPKLIGQYARRQEFRRLLDNLNKELKPALEQPFPGHPKLLGIKLYVYGFSRGAATARAFVNWLSELMPEPENRGEAQPLCLSSTAGDIPLSVEFLGLFDTVASVGVAHMAPVAEGHMSWADGTMELPDNGLVKRCVHLVSSHEQRLCFPLDSICRADGRYPANSVEVVYPGVHSDLGGGYPPGEQGKASGSNDRLLMSQIPLNEMYAAAFAVGAPLKVLEKALPNDLKKDSWRIMPVELGHEFDVGPVTVQRFNNWRKLTLNIPDSGPISDEQAAQFSPVRAPVNIIQALENQIGWITAWRINRYAGGSFRTQGFYHDAALNNQDQDNDPRIRMARERVRDKAQEEVRKARLHELARHPREAPFVLLPAGVKDFDAALGQTQLLQAAIEFKEDYHEQPRSQAKSTTYRVMDWFKGFVYAFNQDDVPVEFRRIKQDGDQRVAILFPPQGEQSNASEASGLTRALFDDQIHDSRAWFMHNAIGSREPWGSYFLYWMIYFGEAMSKKVKPLAMLGYVAGLAAPVSVQDVRFTIKRFSEDQPLAKASAAHETITVVSAENEQQQDILQDKSRQIVCVQHPASVQAECQNAQQQDWERKMALVQEMWAQSTQ
ncbi:DUF2235 domain-containing protein [Enterobacter sp. CC120223-11]|uniref:T6SS phospholipase effector Tle1-like catalytic domain-containing protein n=1 Tax=Enterobacter sp. CC120223-11 TaxID=1378073 RepID=UPI000BD3065E|nr:DUF2235 domain-containing protein [Enterobacter sp. CC120223-11]SNY59043.1 Uncharacterized alpha/beta hydrolase domain [Enterobacter sp. CC120223-11]